MTKTLREEKQSDFLLKAFELGAVKWITKPQCITGYSKLFEELFSAS